MTELAQRLAVIMVGALVLVPGCAKILEAEEPKNDSGFKLLPPPTAAASALNIAEVAAVRAKVMRPWKAYARWVEPGVIISDPQSRPVYVHCEQGVGRTGLMVAIFRVLHRHYTVEQAIQEARDMGMSSEAQFEFIRQLANRHE